jgi:hypothetical protein
MINSIVEAEQLKDSLLESVMEKLNIESDEELRNIITPSIERVISNPRIVGQITPLVPVEWGQRAPFNDNLINSKCASGKNLAGCVAVAVAHIMSYWKYPSSINGHSFNWTELNQYTARPKFYDGAGSYSVFSAPNNVKIQLGNLFQQIGWGVFMNWDCGASGAKTANSVNFLSRQGFKIGNAKANMGVVTGGVKNYDFNTVVASLNNRRPLMIAGYSYAKTVTTTFLGIQVDKSTEYSGGHQWIIDGYLKQEVKHIITVRQLGQIISQTTAYFYPEYLHNNWGWNGDYNGYFASGVFYAKGERIGSNIRSGEDLNFQYNIKIVPDIHR